ncbi:MAG: cache domain-containing protein, partial [Desulfobulbaceae bacterium]|nr:cache domain-containing protein [Desulfobulbaceae bacterium]
MTSHIHIKSSLILLASIITMVLIAYTMIRSHIEFRDTMVIQAQQQLLTIAETTANNVENFIFIPSVALNKAASLTIQAAGNPQSTTNSSLQKQLPLQTFSLIYGKGLDAVFILDLTGKIILSYSPVTGVTKIPERGKLDPYAISSALKNHRTYIGTAFFNENEELTISITEPILNDQKILIGLTQRILNINYLTRTLIKPIQSQGAKHTWMFDQRKVILAHPTSDYVGLSISDIIKKLHESSGEHFHSHELKEHISKDHAYFDKVLVKKQGTGIFKSCSSYDKELVAYHTIKIGDKRWGLVVTLPYNEIAGPVTEHGKRVFGLAFLTIIILYTGSVIIFQGKKRRSELEKEANYLKNLATSAQKLREEEQRFRDLVENSPMGIIIKHNENIAYRNPEQERLFGETSNKFLEINTIHP